jgi:hypothetical protein
MSTVEIFKDQSFCYGLDGADGGSFTDVVFVLLLQNIVTSQIALYQSTSEALQSNMLLGLSLASTTYRDCNRVD